MSQVSRPLPGLFGGVSQQIPAMRHPTHCSVQDNGLATLVDGLYKRPGSQHVATLALTGGLGGSVAGTNGIAHSHTIDKGPSEVYELLLVDGNLMLYSKLTGAVQEVLCPNGRTYLATSNPEKDFRCVTVADYTFIVNRSKVVKMLPAVTASNPVHVAYISVRTAVPKVKYKITIDSISGEHTTGDSPTTQSVAQALRDALALALPSYTCLVLNDGNLVKVIGTPGNPITCRATDGWGGQTMRVLNDGVDRYADLPASFEAGYVVRIDGSAETSDDPYYVRWSGSRWEETLQPGLTYGLDKTTMPHQLRPDGVGGWVFEPAPNWAPRKIGDEDTNPPPSFVDRTINGCFFFRNRLGFLSGDSLTLSKAGGYFDFWASTATQVLDTDPIDLDAPAENVQTLDWAVDYNTTLMVWASPNKQFVLAAGDVLSPNTARLQPGTTFEADMGVRPVFLGSRILFGTTAGSNLQVNLFKVSEDTVTNLAEDLTVHCPKYVPALPRTLAASTAMKALAVIPSGPSTMLYLFKYEEDEGQGNMTQKAWQRFGFAWDPSTRFLNAHWVSRKLYVTTWSPTVQYQIKVLDFEMADDLHAGFSLCLDDKATAAIGAFDGTNTTVTVPQMDPANLVFLQCVDGAEPVQLTPVGSTIDYSYKRSVVTLPGDLTGATVWAGRRYQFLYEFTEVFLRDPQSVPIMAANVKLARMLVRYTGTGYFLAKVKSLLRDGYSYPFSGRTIGQPGQGASQLALSEGSFSIPVNAKAAAARITLESDSWLPCKFPYAEWVGDVNMKAQR